MYNILYVFCGEEASGAEIVIERLISSNEKVNATLFIAPGPFQKLIQSSAKCKIRIIPELRKLNRKDHNLLYNLFNIFLRTISLFFTILKQIRLDDISVIHANTVVPSSFLILNVVYSKLFNSKLKWIWSDHDFDYYNKFDKFLSKVNARIYDCTLTVSLAVKQKHANYKVINFYNGVDTIKFFNSANHRKKFREKLNIQVDTFVIGIAGPIVPRKGQVEFSNFLINNLKEINIILLIGGRFSKNEPDYKFELEEIIKTHGNRIKFLGSIDDMLSYYNGCDLIINNSYSEAFGMTLVEAMACEKVVMAPRVGGCPEIVDHEKDGFLFSHGDFKEMSAIIIFIIKNFKNLDYIRKNARKKVLNKFSINVMVNSYNNIIGKLIRNEEAI